MFGEEFPQSHNFLVNNIQLYSQALRDSLQLQLQGATHPRRRRLWGQPDM